uniref:Uncharacterized protein n=1 Tax=Anguilla anguilla TaxID=7936 RepID=A0A0E9RVH6_ANGAN
MEIKETFPRRGSDGSRVVFTSNLTFPIKHFYLSSLNQAPDGVNADVSDRGAQRA